MGGTLINQDTEYLKYQKEICRKVREELPAIENAERCIQLADEVMFSDEELCGTLLKKAMWFAKENRNNENITKILDLAFKIDNATIFNAVQEEFLRNEPSP